MLFGAFFSIADDLVTTDNMDQDWIDLYEENEDIVQWLTPLIPTIGIFIAVIKILMTSSVRGRD